jgi:hypothetical protein
MKNAAAVTIVMPVKIEKNRLIYPIEYINSEKVIWFSLPQVIQLPVLASRSGYFSWLT